MSSSTESDTPQNLETENEGIFKYHRNLKRLRKEFPDIYEDENPFEVWGWTVRPRRRIIIEAKEKIASDKMWLQFTQTTKGMSLLSEMPEAWKLVWLSEMV